MTDDELRGLAESTFTHRHVMDCYSNKVSIAECPEAYLNSIAADSIIALLDRLAAAEARATEPGFIARSEAYNRMEFELAQAREALERIANWEAERKAVLTASAIAIPPTQADVARRALAGGEAVKVPERHGTGHTNCTHPECIERRAALKEEPTTMMSYETAVEAIRQRDRMAAQVTILSDRLAVAEAREEEWVRDVNHLQHELAATKAELARVRAALALECM